MTKLASLARHRRAAALSRLASDAIANDVSSNVIAVNFRPTRMRPVLPPDLGLRPAAPRTAANVTAFALAA